MTSPAKAKKEKVGLVGNKRIRETVDGGHKYRGSEKVETSKRRTTYGVEIGSQTVEDKRRRDERSEGTSKKKYNKNTVVGEKYRLQEDMNMLPERLFATDRVPVNGRINSYSKQEYLLDIKDALYGTEELEWLRESPFGRLFELPVRKCSLSGKLVHQFLCRSLVTSKKYELWFVFGGNPIRFSLHEFALLTGLRCDPYPSEEETTKLQKPAEGDEPYWYTLIGNKQSVTIGDVVDMLKVDKRMDVRNRMSGERRLKLSLLVLVDGILLSNSSCVKPSKEVVEMLKDLDSFYEYPWGRKSFEFTLQMVKVGSKVESVEALAGKLSKPHTSTHGFTLAIQLLILNTVPHLGKLLPEKGDDRDFLDPSIVQLKTLKKFHTANIAEVEREPNVKATSILERGFPLETSDFSWDDEEEDMTVDNILEKLSEGYKFKKEDWIGGLKTQPLITEILTQPKTEGKKVVKVTIGPGRQTTVGGLKKKDKGRGTISGAGGGDDDGRNKTKIEREVEKLFREHKEQIKKLEDELLANVLKAVSEMGSSGSGDGRQRLDVWLGSDIETKLDETIEADESTKTWMKDAMDIEQNIKAVDKVNDNVNKISSSEEEGYSAERGDTGKLKGDDENEEVIMDNDDEEDSKEENEEEEQSERDGLGEGESEGDGEKAKDGEDEKTVNEGGDDEGFAKKDEEKEEDDNARQSEGDENEEEGDGVRGSSREDKEEDGKIAEDDETVERETVDTKFGTGNKAEISIETSVQMGGRRIAAAPKRSKRPRKNPTRFGHEETEKELGYTIKADMTMYNPLEAVDDATKEAFKAKLAGHRGKDYIVNGHSVKKTFFKAIYTPKNHVDSHHIEVILSLVWRRLGESLLEKRVAVLDPWFTQLMCTDHGRYKNIKTGQGAFSLNNNIRNYVRGKITSRSGKMAWMVDVDDVYAPMHWGKNHWVAVCINLKTGKILILDPLIEHTPDSKLPKLMKPLTEMVPIIIKELVNTADSTYPAPKKFEYQRHLGVSQNPRTGDCGPMVAKFIELFAQGMAVEGITEAIVDEIRMKYAIEIYEEFVEALE